MPSTYSGMTLDQLRAASRLVDPSSHNTTDEQSQAIYDVNPQWMSSFQGLPSELAQMSADYYNGQSDPNFSGVRPDAAFSQGLISGGFQPKEALAPDGKSVWRWVEDAQGNVVVQPEQINQEDPAFAAAAAAAIAAVTAGTVNAGFGVGGAPGGVAGGALPAPGAGGLSDPFSLGGSFTPEPVGAAVNATNPALIESALGTPGYGASSAGLGGGTGALAGPVGNATNAALIESAVGTPGYGASSAGLGGGAGVLSGPTASLGLGDVPSVPGASAPTSSASPASSASTNPFGLSQGVWDKLLQAGLGGLLGAGLNELGPDMPTPPNPVDTINAQTDANIKTADINTANGRPNVTNPFGSSTWTRVADPTMPGGFRWTNDIKFSDEQQGLYDTTVENQQSLLNTSSGLLDRINANYSTPFDLASYGEAGKLNTDPNQFSAERDQVQQALYDRLTRTRTPQMERDRAQLDTTLRNQGLSPGTEAYANSMRQLLEAQSGELQDYNSRSVEMGGNEQSRLNTDLRNNTGFNNTVRQNSIQEGLTQRNMPLSEYNALTNGTQPTLPTFQAYGTGTVQPTNVQGVQQQGYSNAQDTYNARMAQYQNILNFGTKVGG